MYVMCVVCLSGVCIYKFASQVAQWVKNPPAMQKMQEMQVQFLGQEDPLEKENGNPLQYYCLENPWTEEPGGL